MAMNDYVPSKGAVGGVVSALILSGCTGAFTKSNGNDVWRTYDSATWKCTRTLENVTSLGSSISTTITMPAPCRGG